MDADHGKKPEAVSRQREIDFTRGEQLSILRDALIPDHKTKDGSVASGKVIKAVLRAIDDFGRGKRCWAHFERLAQSAGCGRRTAIRAVEALAAMSLIVEERVGKHGGGSRKEYTIVWTELALKARFALKNDSAMRGTESATVTSESATVTTESATVAHPSEAFLKRSRNVSPSAPQNRFDPLWEKAKKEIFSLGINDVRGAVRAAKDHGLSAGHVLALVEHYRSQVQQRPNGDLKIGFLYWRITHDNPDVSPAERWPGQLPPRGASASNAFGSLDTMWVEFANQEGKIAAQARREGWEEDSVRLQLAVESRQAAVKTWFLKQDEEVIRRRAIAEGWADEARIQAAIDRRRAEVDAWLARKRALLAIS